MSPITVGLYLCCVISFAKAVSLPAIGIVTKNGCPNTDGIFGICLFDPMRNCIGQEQCPEGYKCCPYGCGSQCLAVTVHFQHLGSCPAQLTGTGTACNSDPVCNANEKCCNGHCEVVRPSSVPVIGVLVSK